VSATIRTATLDDAEALQTYAAGLFAEDLPGIFRRDTPTLDDEREFIRARIEPERSTLILAVENGEVVGVIDLIGRAMAEEAHCGEFGISVAREQRGKGVGTALIEAILLWAPEHGIDRVEVQAWSSNPRALALYERLGFVREGARVGAMRRDGETADVILLARRL
jgi:RimJ/RimL family protein N-acetyltransferase